MCKMVLRCLLSLCVVLSVCWARDVREVVQTGTDKGIIHRPRRAPARPDKKPEWKEGADPLKDDGKTIMVEGLELKLMCPAKGRPRPDIEWYRNGAAFIPDRPDRVQVKSSNLKFISVEPEDTGAYTCIASNTAGQIEFTFHLEVIGACAKEYNNAPDGTVNSPTVYNHNGTQFYRAEEDCIWRFTNDDGVIMKLTSTKFAVEESENCEFDYVEITEEGVAESLRVCGWDPVGYISTGPNVNIKFVTDDSFEYDGISFEFKRLETANIDSSKCDSNILGGPNGHIHNLPSDTISDCFYRIQAPDAEHVVELHLEQLDFGSNMCKDECLFIYDGLTTRNEMGRIDKNSGTGFLKYRANSVFIRYTRRVKAEGERFRLAYRFVENTFTPAPTPSTTPFLVGGQNDCSRQYEDEVEIDYTSPTYQNDKECVIVARNTALHNRVVQIEFVDFELEPSYNCQFDYLKVLSSERKDSESLGGPYCDTDLRGKTFISNSNSIRLEFRTDESFVLFGFRAKIKFIPADVCECSEGFVCVMEGFEKICKIGTDCRSSYFCENGGTCVKAMNDKVCYCRTGFTGETCSEGEGGIKTLRFSKTPKSQNIKRNQGMDAECKAKVDKTEDVDYKWTLRGNPIGPYNDDTGFGYLDGGLLTIDKFSDRMEGTYSCIATTNSSQAEYTFKYTLIEDCSIHISSGPKDDEKKVGQRVLLECVAKSAESITWKKDGKTIEFEKDGRIQILSIYYLRIDNVQKSDEGTYKCIAAGKRCFSYREAELKVSTDKMHKNYCGRSVHDVNHKAEGFISQGYNAKEKMHPWHVNFFTDFGDNTTDESFCGGTIISQKYVLTAAHCITDFLKKFPGKTIEGNVKLFLGTNNCTGQKEGVTIRRPKSFLKHEEFESAIFNNDIAVIELSIPVVYSDNIRPICLESREFTDMLLTDTLQTPYGRVVGCGKQKKYQLHSNTLKEVYVPYVPRSECETTMEAATQIPINDAMFCAGKKLAMQGDACKGDSGGSLVMTRDSIQYWVQTGIVSWGAGCDKQGVYGVYTNVALFYNWIRENTHFDEEVVAPFF